MLKPEYYTETEGGNWIRWPQEVSFLFAWTYYRTGFPIIITMNGTKIDIYSIAFDDPAIGIGRFLRWDCVNGFNN